MHTHTAHPHTPHPIFPTRIRVSPQSILRTVNGNNASITLTSHSSLDLLCSALLPNTLLPIYPLLNLTLVKRSESESEQDAEYQVLSKDCQRYQTYISQKQ